MNSNGQLLSRLSSSLLPPWLRWSGPFLALSYGLGLRVHRGLAKPQYAPIATLCIGNLTVGGTGKTPATKYFARGLAERGRKPAALLRGYKEQSIDEAVEITRALSDLNVPVIIGADRLNSARQAREQGCDVAVLDDGFQHWRLARDLDIVLVDATQPFSDGHLAPWGRLREQPESLARAGVVIITRADAITKEELTKLEKDVRKYAPQTVLAKARHAPITLRACNGNQAALPLEKLKGLPVSAVCGVGNPSGFFHTLRQAGANTLQATIFDDHCEYDAREIASRLIPQAQKIGASAIVVTEKDAVKLEPLLTGISFPILALSVRFEIFEGEAALWDAVEHALTRSAQRLG
ncbi:MAG: tetraacyldisaccharide 4'-kinase [Planctomycetota bacterium]